MFKRTAFSLPGSFTTAMKMGSRHLFQAALAVTTAAFATTLLAQVTSATWNDGGGDGSWGNTANWSTGVVPAALDADVVIDGNADNVAGFMTLNKAHRLAGLITLTGSAEKYIWASSPGEGYTSARRLQIGSGITMDATSGSAFIGYADEPAIGRVAARAVATQTWRNESSNDLNFGRPVTRANATASGSLIAGFFGSSPRPDVTLTLDAAGSGNIVLNGSMNNGYTPAVGETGLAVAIDSQGTGLVYFNNAVSHTGGTVVRNGTLAIGNGSTDAGFVIGDVVVEQGGALIIDQPAGTTYFVGSSVPDNIYMTNVSGAGPLTLRGGATFEVIGPATNTGGTTVAGGTAVLKSGGSLAGPVTLSAGGGLTVDAGLSKSLDSLNLAGGLLDVGSGRLEIATGGISESALRTALQEGRNGGGWDGSTGVVSAAAAVSSGSRAVGYLVAGDGTTTVAFAAPGDTSLDGQVDNFDLIAMSTSEKFGTGQPASWAQGDANYDGVFNLADLVLVDAAGVYGQGPYLATQPASITAVPEPGTCGLLAALAGLAAFAINRRERSRDAA